MLFLKFLKSITINVKNSSDRGLTVLMAEIIETNLNKELYIVEACCECGMATLNCLMV